ncbi:MAG: transcriptional regulator, partial [Acidimicrobiales bacterium]
RAGRPSTCRLLERLAEVLAAHGYEPHLDHGLMTLENCPFRVLSEGHRELVCGMNYEIIAGLLEAIDFPGATAQLVPGPGRCCVTVRAN